MKDNESAAVVAPAKLAAKPSFPLAQALQILAQLSFTITILGGRFMGQLNIMTVLLGVLTIIGCSKAPSIPEGYGRLDIKLTDAPADFEAVNITFSEISAHIDSEWIMVRVDPVTVNLLEFSNGKTFDLASANLPAGDYTQIRLKIDDAEVVVNGQAFPVFVPSGAQTGLKLIAQFTILEGVTLELMLDFDARRSIVTTGPPHNPRSYLLKPTIRVIAKSETGSISGMVSNAEHLPFAYAIAGDDTAATTAVEKSSGKFVLAFLAAGLYTVSLEDTLNQSYSSDNVMVTAGAETKLGTVTLQ